MRAAPVISGVNRTGASDHVSWLAAVEALQAVWRLPLEDPRREAMHAIAYLQPAHAWFWTASASALYLGPGRQGG